MDVDDATGFLHVGGQDDAARTGRQRDVGAHRVDGDGMDGGTSLPNPRGDKGTRGPYVSPVCPLMAPDR